MEQTDQNIQDIYLVRRALEGDDDAFACLVDRYKYRIYQFIYQKIPVKGEVEDLAQEVFLRVYRALIKFDQKKRFSTWIYTIANNLVIDYLRKKRLNAVSLDAPLFPTSTEQQIRLEIPDEEYAPEQVFQRTEAQENILRAIDNLPEEYSIVLKLRHLKGFSYEEIKEILDIPLGTIKSRIYRGRQELRNILFKERGGKKDGVSRSI